MTTDRLDALEAALAHMESAVDDLSAELLRQGGEIDALKAENNRLKARLARLEEEDAGDESFVPGESGEEIMRR